MRYYERIGGETANDVSFRCYNSAAANITTTLYFKVRKRAGAIVTKNGTWAVSNCGQPSVAGGGTRTCVMFASVTALGDAFFATADATTYVDVNAEM
jgi:hypothetical protein